jgi:hypothetical protein
VSEGGARQGEVRVGFLVFESVGTKVEELDSQSH